MHILLIINYLQFATSLQRNAVQEGELAVGNKFEEVEKYCVETRHSFTPYYVVMNLDRWNEMTPEQQDAVTRAMAEATQFEKEQSAKYEAEDVGTIEAAGCKVIKLSDEALAEFKAAADSAGNGEATAAYFSSGGTAGDNSAVVGYAMSKIGCPYVWGAEGPDAFDCSGLVRWAYLQIGMSLPHYTESLFASATNRVPVSEARPGDVLYRPGHVGIAVGYGGVPYVHAPTFGAYVRDTDALSWSGFTYALQF